FARRPAASSRLVERRWSCGGRDRSPRGASTARINGYSGTRRAGGSALPDYDQSGPGDRQISSSNLAAADFGHLGSEGGTDGRQGTGSGAGATMGPGPRPDE